MCSRFAERQRRENAKAWANGPGYGATKIIER